MVILPWIFRILKRYFNMASQKPIQIQIPTPCREDWNAMESVEKGRFCSSCRKTVIDFTRFSDTELLRYFNENQGNAVCGQLREDQQRVHYPTIVSRPVRWWPLVLGSFLGSLVPVYAHQDLPQALVNTGKDQFQNPFKLTPTPEGILIKGQIFDSSSNEVISFASIRVVGHSLATATNIEGKFSMKVPDSLFKDFIHLKIYRLGYKTIFLNLSRTDTIDFLRVNLSEEPEQKVEQRITMRGAICRKTVSPHNSFWGRITSIFRRRKQPIEPQ